jgi:MoxR-like ATPase
MPGIQQIYRIIKHLPISQPILLQGKHGVGKSDILRKMFEEDGYRIQPLFLGQAADAGDLIGLPNRVSLRNQDGSIMLDPLGQERIVSDFAPPIWWPFAEDEKVVIFFDEVNRGKPEMMQCIMDLTLNRKLNGRQLPKHTRIIAAMNPLEDGYYQVEDLDPAFLDRWNVYDFTPTKDEWLQWANESGIHKHVIGFINTYKDYLDTPTSSKTKASEVQPSRRSWERVSDVINMTPDLIKDLFLLNDIMAGIVGTSATSALGYIVPT